MAHVYPGYPQRWRAGVMRGIVGRRSTSMPTVVGVLTAEERQEVEEVVLRYIATRSRDFPKLRASGEVPLDLLARGALEHPVGKYRWRCIDLLDHLGDASADAIFRTALNDPLPRVRRHAQHALDCMKCRPR